MAHCDNDGYSSAIEARAHFGKANKGKNTKTPKARSCSAPAVTCMRRAHQEKARSHQLQIPPQFLRMDFSDVGVRHTILNSIQLHHFIDFSPSAAAIAKEARLCVIAVVVGWITTRVVSSLCDLPRSCTCDSNRSRKRPVVE